MAISLGCVDITVDTDEDCLVDFSYSLIEIDASMESDPETTSVVNEWESRVKKLVDRPFSSQTAALINARPFIKCPLKKNASAQLFFSSEITILSLSNEYKEHICRKDSITKALTGEFV